MSFHGKHGGVPCANYNCALPVDIEEPIQPVTVDELAEGIATIQAATSGQDPAFIELLQHLSNEFDAVCMERHDAGAEKYGPGKFLLVDTIEEALEEIVDLANYARYSFIRLRLVQEQIQAQLAATDVGDASTGFIKSGKATEVKEPRA